MGYAEVIEECSRYIEENLQKDLSARELAKKYHYSYYHFCRLFQVIKDVSIAEYIRNCRLEKALTQIAGGSGILETALEVGFETPSGFTKAFKRKYGCTPTEFFHQNNKCGGKQNMQEPRITELPRFYVLGHKKETEVKKADETAGAYWYQGSTSGSHGHGKMQQDTVKIGLWLKEPDEEGNLQYFFGWKTDTDACQHEGLETIEIPSGTYAVFTTQPLNLAQQNSHGAFAEQIKRTWKYIYQNWLGERGYVLDENGYEFEYYDIRCTDKEACCMDIYVAVKKES